MPADNSLPDTPTALHGDARQPYPCHAWEHAPGHKPNAGGTQWQEYGYCRTSLDTTSGATDPRCPADCKHKAPAQLAQKFSRIFESDGLAVAIEFLNTQPKK